MTHAVLDLNHTVEQHQSETGNQKVVEYRLHIHVLQDSILKIKKPFSGREEGGRPRFSMGGGGWYLDILESMVHVPKMLQMAEMGTGT